jgi:hypothetical protein
MSEKDEAPGVPGRPRVSSPLWPLCASAAICIVLWFFGWKRNAARLPLHAYTPLSLALFAPFEAPFLLTAGVVELVVLAWIAATYFRRPHPWLEQKWSELLERPKAAYGAFAFVAFALGMSVALGIVHLHTMNEDEKTYLFQAWLLLRGGLTVPVPAGAEAFWQPFVVFVDGKWTAQYFWAQPAALALATLVNFPWIVPALELAATVFFTGLLAAEYTDARAGVIAALLAATSPMLVMTGGTLHNANLSATCAAASLWALVRLSKEQSRSASITLGLATAVALHNRPLDEAALLFGAGILLAVKERRNLPVLLRRLAPAVLVAAPLLALIPFLNRAQSGSFWHSGYWLFNEGKGWKTMGFGRGPFGQAHTVAMAATKTLAALVRVSFFVTGCPVGWLFACLPLLGISRKGARAMAPLVVVAVYVASYFFYAASSITPTGPVYYVALAPLLIALIATYAVELFDWLRQTGKERLIPAVLIGQGVAALLIFWPPELLQLARGADDSAKCDALAQVAGIDSGLVFVDIGFKKPAMSWTSRPPFALPPFDAPLLFAPSKGAVEDAKTASRFAGDRPLYFASCIHEDEPTLLSYDPAHERTTPLEGADFSVLRSPPASSVYW